MIKRIDDLGRIVMPKELRLRFGIKNGDSLEWIIKDGMICLKKAQSYDDEKAYQPVTATIPFEEG